VLGLPDGFIANLTMTTGAVYETPDHNPAKQHFTPGYLMLRGSRDLRDLVNVAPATNGYAFQWWGPVANKVINGSLSYEGALVVEEFRPPVALPCALSFQSDERSNSGRQDLAPVPRPFRTSGTVPPEKGRGFRASGNLASPGQIQLRERAGGPR
jgi:hypothetical protein